MDRTLVTALTALSLFVLASTVGCAPTRLPGRHAATPDAGPGDAPTTPSSTCGEGLPSCVAGTICQSVHGAMHCVADPSMPRTQYCNGEFDTGCGAGMLCVAGTCTRDPRLPNPCTDDSTCPSGNMCVAGQCVCAHSSDCPSGLECSGGACVPGLGACVADADCPTGMICEGGVCLDRALCDATSPDLTGTWQMHSTLRFREALPGWLSDLLDALEGPFRFLGGETTCIDFGLPSFVESLICSAIGPYVEAHFPAWSRSLFLAIADLNTVLSTWDIDETMVLDPGAVTDTYRGHHTWDRIRFTSRSTMLVADPTTVFDWSFEPSTFDAAAVCGTFEIRRHDVNVSIGRIIAWLVDAVVEESSDGAYHTLDAALSDMTSGFCAGLADAASSAVTTPGVGIAVRSACESELGDLTDRLTSAIAGARLGVDVVSLRGSAPIAGPDSLPDGLWDGALLGSEFSGDFSAWR